MHSDYKRIVPLPPLAGALGAKYALVSARESEFQQTLGSDEADGQNEKSCVHPRSPANACLPNLMPLSI
jgi:hypothetical protein